MGEQKWSVFEKKKKELLKKKMYSNERNTLFAAIVTLKIFMFNNSRSYEWRESIKTDTKTKTKEI